MDPRRTTGDRGEDLVARYLTERGWTVLARNWRCVHGEVDLIAADPEGGVAVVEVKTRSGTGWGSPLEAITRAKLMRLRRLAAAWAREQDAPVPSLRVDAVGVVWHRDGTASVEHVRGLEP
jgi:putative endonuclease